MSLARRPLLALVGALAIHPAWATTVVAFYTREAVFIGADSKFVGPDGVYGFDCKIHREDGIVWASAGLQVGGGLIRVPEGAIGPATSFPNALRTLARYTARQLPVARRIGLQEGEPPHTLHVDLAVAGIEDGQARLTIVGFGRSYFGHSDYAPIECRPGGGPGCGNDYIFEMGYVSRIQDILGKPSGGHLVARLGPAAAIKYLIAEEERARSEFVGGPISILRLDRSGIRWVDRGLCH